MNESRPLSHWRKSLNLMHSFARRGMIHCNLQVLYHCNFRCAICDFWKDQYHDSPVLSVGQTRVIADRLASLGSLVISIGGGEPLLHPQIIAITEILARRHFPMMITNGFTATPELARELFSAGMYEVSVSLDYRDAQRHDAQRGRDGAHERALAALEMFHRARTHPRQRVHMITVVMDDTIDEVEHLIRRADAMGITFFVTFYSSARGAKELRAERADISRRLLELKRRYPAFVAISEYLARFSEAGTGGIAPCHAGRHLFNIDCAGNVARCIDRHAETVGNILTDDFSALLSTLRTQAANDPCGACWTSCRGNIETLLYGRHTIRNFLEYRDIVKSVPLVRS